jgi:carboxypeptidase C (cathepsin A)
MIYSGQLDVIVGASLTESFLSALQWSGASGFAQATKNIWKVTKSDIDVAGWARQYQNLTHVIVRSAGYVVFVHPSSTSPPPIQLSSSFLSDVNICPLLPVIVDWI